MFAGEVGLESDTAFRLAQGLGAGLARTDGTCGVINSAALVIGLRVPADANYAARRERVYALVQEFVHIFREQHGVVSCPELLGCSLSTPDGRARARETAVCDRVCPEMVASAVTILEGLFQKAGL